MFFITSSNFCTLLSIISTYSIISLFTMWCSFTILIRPIIEVRGALRSCEVLYTNLSNSEFIICSSAFCLNSLSLVCFRSVTFLKIEMRPGLPSSSSIGELLISNGTLSLFWFSSTTSTKLDGKKRSFSVTNFLYRPVFS